MVACLRQLVSRDDRASAAKASPLARSAIRSRAIMQPRIGTAAARHLDPDRNRHRFGDAAQAVRLSAPERPGTGVTRSRAAGTLDLHARLIAGHRSAQQADPGRVEQGRGAQWARPSSLLQPARRTARPSVREPVLPRLRPQPAGRGHHPVEHPLSRTGIGRHGDAGRGGPPYRAARLGAHRAYRPL